MNIKGSLISIISDHFEVEKDSIKGSSGIEADDIEGWDSLGHLTLIMEIESHFGIKFETDQISKLNSVDEIEKSVLMLVKE